jgi:hypothetical protein
VSTGSEQTVVRAEGTMALSDHLWAQFVHLRPRRTFAILGLLLVFAYLVVVGLAVTRESSWHWPVILLVPGLYLLIFFLVWVPWRTRRTFRQQKRLLVPIRLEIAHDGMRTSTQFSDVRLPWDGFLKWREGSGVFLLYYSDHLFQIVPVRFFSTLEESSAFRAVLVEKVGRAT